MKWVWVAVLIVIGILAAIVAIEYFTVSIHSLPSFIPGHKPIYGHYRKRGAVAAVVAIVAFAAAAVLAIRFSRQAAPPPGPAPSSAGDLLSSGSDAAPPQAPPSTS
jgi:uncharacterized membrane protein YidH (DUF202 family)